MEHEKIIKRDNGTRVKIRVEAYMDSFSGDGPKYSFTASSCEKSKRTFKSPSFPEYEYRKLSMGERRKYMEPLYLTICTREEVNAIYLELWEKMKPELLGGSDG